MWLFISLLLAAFIAALSLLHGEAWIVRVTPEPLQKVLHTVFYAALMGCLLMAQSSFHLNPWLGVFLAAVGALALGASLQFLQGYRPGRFARFTDFIRDGAGVLVGVAVWLVVHP